MRQGFVLPVVLLLLIGTASTLHIFLIDDIRAKNIPEDGSDREKRGRNCAYIQEGITVGVGGMMALIIVHIIHLASMEHQ